MPVRLRIGAPTESFPFVYEEASDVLPIAGGRVRMRAAPRPAGPAGSDAAFAAAGSASFAATGASRVACEFHATGSSSFSATGAARVPATFDMAGAASFSAGTSAGSAAAFAAAGGSSFAATGASRMACAFHARGSSSFSATGAARVPATFDMAGNSSFSAGTSAGSAAAFAAAGSSSFAATGASRVACAFHATGSSSFSAMGAARSGAGFQSAGSGAMSATGAARSPAAFTAAGTSTLSADGQSAAAALALESLAFTAGHPNTLDVTYAYSGASPVVLHGVTSTSPTPPDKAAISAGTGDGTLEAFSGTVSDGGVTLSGAFTSASHPATYIHAYLVAGSDESAIATEGDGSLLGISDRVAASFAATGTGALAPALSARVRASMSAAGSAAMSAALQDAAAGALADPSTILGANALSWWRADTDVFSDAGSTAAVADGVVQQITDQAGGAAFTSAGALRPTLRVAGGYSAIDMDGAYLTRALSTSGAWYMCAAVEIADARSDNVYFMHSLRGAGAWWQTGYGGMSYFGYSQPNLRVQTEHNLSDGSALADAPGGAMVIEAWAEASGLVGLCYNGGADTTYTGGSAAGPASLSNLDIGRINDGGAGWGTDNGADFRIFGSVTASGGLPSAGDRADIRAWAASLNGVTL